MGLKWTKRTVCPRFGVRAGKEEREELSLGTVNSEAYSPSLRVGETQMEGTGQGGSQQQETSKLQFKLISF